MRTKCPYCGKAHGKLSCGDGTDKPGAFICTRPEGHAGEHVACAESKHDVARWKKVRR